MIANVNVLLLTEQYIPPARSERLLRDLINFYYGPERCASLCALRYGRTPHIPPTTLLSPPAPPPAPRHESSGRKMIPLKSLWPGFNTPVSLKACTPVVYTNTHTYIRSSGHDW